VVQNCLILSKLANEEEEWRLKNVDYVTEMVKKNAQHVAGAGGGLQEMPIKRAGGNLALDVMARGR
jgi:hypothetical protein